MDRITEAFVKEFVDLNDLEKLNESDQFEYFANHCIVSKEYGNTNFDLDEISTGKGTQGIDGIAIIVNNKLVETTKEIKDLIELNNILNVKFVFIQSKRSNKFNNNDILNFFHWTKMYFKDNSNLFKTEEMKKFIELKEFIYHMDNCRYMIKNNPILSMYYVTTGNWIEDKNLLNVIDNEKNSLIETNLFNKVEFKSIGANEIQRFYRATKEKSSATFF